MTIKDEIKRDHDLLTEWRRDFRDWRRRHQGQL